MGQDMAKRFPKEPREGGILKTHKCFKFYFFNGFRTLEPSISDHVGRNFHKSGAMMRHVIKKWVIFGKLGGMSGKHSIMVNLGSSPSRNPSLGLRFLDLPGSTGSRNPRAHHATAHILL